MPEPVTKDHSPAHKRVGAHAASIPISVLLGLRSLPRECEDAVRASQLRAVDRMAAVRAAVALVSIGFVDVLCWRHFPHWMVLAWTMLALAVRVPLIRMHRRNRELHYHDMSRRRVLHHALLSLITGLVWSLPSIAAAHADPIDMIALWTLTSCLMTATSIGFHATPLSAVAFLTPLGLTSVGMMLQQGDALLTAVVGTYSLALLAISLRQAQQFGEQLTTSNELAEKHEVVRLLLREHDLDGADWLWQTDAGGRLREVSPAFAQMLGSTSAALDGRDLIEAIGALDVADGPDHPSIDLLVEKLRDRTAFTDLDLSVPIDGERRWWRMSASPRTDEKGRFLGFRGVGSDVTASRESAERIAQLARHDMLTDLPNRLSLTEELTAAIDHVERRQGRCAFMMIDLDRFKIVNDTLGHQMGDTLLMRVAERLRAVCSVNEVFGRLGGDEFAVVLRDVPDDAYVERLAEAIIAAVSAPFSIKGHALHIGASIGSALAPYDGNTVSAVMRGADLAMYRAKEAGGDRHIAFVPAMQADIEERLLLEAALRDALAMDELHVVYQPIVEAASGAVTTFEALVRWTHPVLGPVPPSRFIPVAEEARLIRPIGDWVLRTACIEAMSWPDHIRVSVNISPEQLRDPLFLETVISALAHAGLPASRLELEVTESLFLRERGGAIALLERLTGLGVRVVLDDFGIGHSSIGYLSRTCFSAIKIDRAFVCGAAQGQRESLAIVRAIVAMADSLAIDSIAEGVESKAEFERMRAFGLNKMQGYYFGRPMVARATMDLFADRDSRVA